jgi:hypothetical protein
MMRGAESWRSLLVAGAVASLLAGIPAGLAARAAMGVLGAAGGSSMMAIVGQLTLPGTLRIVIVPMVFGIPFAWLLLLAGRRWAGRPWPIRAAAYGLAALIVPGLIVLSDSEFNIPGPNSELGRWLFMPVLVVFGVVVGVVGERLLGRTRGAPASG